jgi:hypothetical protein
MAVCARCSAPLVAGARFCAACGSPVTLNTTPRPEPRPPAAAPAQAPVPAPAPSAPDPFAKTVMGDPNAVAAEVAAVVEAARAAGARASAPPRASTAPMEARISVAPTGAAGSSPPAGGTAQIGAVAPARPNPVSPMASSMMSTPADFGAGQRPSAVPAWNVPPQPQPLAPGRGPSQAASPPAPVVQHGQRSMAPGTMVLVYWSNGNRYPGTVLHATGSQVLVAFPNGQQHWVDMKYVSVGG